MDSSAASYETIRSRTADLGKHRRLASGGEEVRQLHAELKARSPAERQEILTELHQGGFKVEVPVHQLNLGMKADLNIPWT